MKNINTTYMQVEESKSANSTSSTSSNGMILRFEPYGINNDNLPEQDKEILIKLRNDDPETKNYTLDLIGKNFELCQALVDVLVEVLKYNTNLKSLWIKGDRDIWNEGRDTYDIHLNLEAFVSILKNNHNLRLRELIIEGSFLDNDTSDEVIEALKQNLTIQIFTMTLNRYPCSTLDKIGDVLLENNNLCEIYLESDSSTDIYEVHKDEEAEINKIARVLEKNNSVRKLHLIHYLDEIGSYGARVIFEALLLNQRLQLLELSYAEISDEAAMALSNMLQVNSTLQILKLSNNKFTEQAIILTAEALKKNINNNIQEIDFTGNPGKVSIDGVKKICAAIKDNWTLTKFKFEPEDPKQQEYLTIQKRLDDNRSNRENMYRSLQSLRYLRLWERGILGFVAEYAGGINPFTRQTPNSYVMLLSATSLPHTSTQLSSASAMQTSSNLTLSLVEEPRGWQRS